MPSFFFHLAFDLRSRNTLPTPSSNSHSPGHTSITSSIHTNDTEPAATKAWIPELSTTAAHSQDWRYGRLSFQTISMRSRSAADKPATESHRPNVPIKDDGTSPQNLTTKGKYEPVGSVEEELGQGVVRLYRDAEQTPGLYDESENAKPSKVAPASSQRGNSQAATFRDEDCTTLCILAVPSYLTPSDFLGFVGEKTREEVSHFRMIRTERTNRYMVLMKFRNGRRAREWRRNWNGKPFDGMEV